MSYSGWTNYPTWAVKLWLDNEEGTYHYVQEAARDIYRRARYLDDAARELASMLESMHEEAAPSLKGVFSDLLTFSLNEVNWGEIAAAVIEDIADEIDEEDKEDEDEDEDEHDQEPQL